MSVRDLIPWGRSESRVPVRSQADPFLALHREVNRLFDDVWRGFGAASATFAQPGGWPNVEVVEGDKHLVVSAELPGLSEKDVEITLDDDGLTLRGERKAEQNGEQQGFVFSERFFGRFQRSIALPSEVDKDGVSASMKDGVLTVTLPKVEAPRRTKRITINGR